MASGCGDFQGKRADRTFKRTYWVARRIRGRSHRNTRDCHAGDKMIYTEQPCEALAGQVIAKGAIYPFQSGR